ncbi:DUF4097 domain-containing protein [Kitasatospora acidiphila]|uniref:DUF4097 domain-containing protein n=1 Tax=Kitasatospora acidiphila TaxID=2567942 RepID=A0A540W7J4_9ACTN|nr:DUF4097 family beta strand repeat-containing protein [Kitasatospora acidiphila]TQF04992.1 DUF4097 domain-containing protein [Kitasatospora acidiphila]
MDNRLTRVLVYAAITGAVLLSMTACDWWGSRKHNDVSYGVSQSVKTLVVQGETGDITVVGGGDAVTVTEHQHYQDQQPVTTHQVSADGTLTLAYHCHDCGVGYDIHVPAGTVVKLTASTGDVDLSGLTADVQADTETGKIRATGLTGGKAELRAQTGDVCASFAGAPRAVNASTETGSVQITVPGGTGYTVAAAAQTGSVKVAVPQDPSTGRTINAHAETGSVAVTGA